MDSISIVQRECLDEILKIKTNFKKDPNSRKTKVYIQARIDRLETLWAEFLRRDLEIRKFKETNPGHQYFVTNFFEESEKHYESVSELLLNKLKEIENQEKKEADEKQRLAEAQALAKAKQAEAEEAARAAKEVASKLSVQDYTQDSNDLQYATRLLRVQQETVKLFERLVQSIQRESDRLHSTVYYQQKLNTIQSYWDKIMMNHTDIVASPNEIYEEYIENNVYQAMEDIYQETVIQLQEKVGSFQRSDDDIKLPRLSIPTFDGDYQSWTSFHDIFVRLIHNNSRLGEAEKMQYLKTHMRKEAASLLQHLTISDANYKTAWKLLNERYNNKRKLFSVQFQILLSQPKLDHESAVGIRKLHDTTKECLHALSNLGIDTTNWAPLIAHIVIQKLDHESHKLYEQGLEKPRELPTYEILYRFLENRFQSLESLKDSKKRENSLQPKTYRTMKNQDWSRYKTYHSAANSVKCSLCHEAHKIYACHRFKTLPVQERIYFVQSNKLCANCLTHRDSEKCHSRFKCSRCKQPHHTLLHQDQKTHTSTHISTTQPKEVQALLSKQNHSTLLATALIKARAVDGRLETLRALVDPGSQASFASESASQMLGLPRTKAYAEISGLGMAASGTARHKTTIILCPHFPSTFSISVEALILPRLTKLLPNKKVIAENTINPWNNVMLADPTYDTPGPIDLIIGADVYHSIILEGIKKSNNLIAQKTEFGWILSGQPADNSSTSITCMVSYTDLDNTLKRFWEIENIEKPIQELSQEDQQCEEHFRNTYQRNTDGSYTVRIPFQNNLHELGESKRRATARLLQNEKRFTSDKKLEKDYKLFMQEYIDLNHMTPISHELDGGYYLPHQAVIKEDSSTTRLRVVFDASSRTTTGISLNDTMYVGPKLQRDLGEILLRWRKHRYVFTADIEKMYRQIKIHNEDLKYQKILWRPTNTQPIREYCLTTVTYGTAAAPYLALRTLQQLALDERQSYPRASHILTTDFYVDDLMTGAATRQEAKEIQKELINLLSSGGFKLRKWTSNQQHLLESVPEDLREKGLREINDEDSIKTLGVHWLPSSDCFQFKVNLSSTNQTVTKRSVLSDIAKLFDPLGWLSPVIIQAKLLMQELWITKLSWDTELPPELMLKWNRFKNELNSVQSIKIYRWIKYNSTNNGIEIHGFCDASEKAYAAVIYSRIENMQGEVSITMLTAKTKVAPITKETTLPRLELCAAVLLTHLLKKVTKSLDITEATFHAWTDSSITLAWIKGDPSRWKSFVAHRVAEIKTFTKPEAWRHIKSEDNPADCASRGVNPSQLKAHTLWWTGPKWLALSKEQWPDLSDNTYKTSKEIRDHHTVLLTTAEHTEIIDRFSDLSRMVRVLTHCARFITCCKAKKRITEGLTTEELHSTLINIVKLIQKECFHDEMHQLSTNQSLPKSSKLLSLTPFLDENGILRVGGRLDNSTLPYNEKHPIILPHKHHFTTLVLRDAHQKTLHGGNQSTHAYVLRRYWIIDAKTAIRRIIHNCTICCRYKAETSKQLMGKLPSPRVIPSKPFTHTGMDYAGPFNLRVSPGRGMKSYKGYIVVFVCLSTKAMHLEAVSTMTTDAFLAAFKRFTARRGLCTDLYSDCGTTFVGAKNELDRQFNLSIQENHVQAAEKLTTIGTQWHFIPPGAPHFGGLWEAGVKSVKYHLKRVAGEINFTFEEFTTLLCQIEACLNSRPLCPLSTEPGDFAAITPGHFLTGSSILMPPEPTPPEKSLHCLKKLELLSKLKNDFWNIWSTEYLSRLQQRPKWTKQQNNIQEGDLVLITDESVSPARWPLGRVIRLHPGSDGLVRVVDVQTAKTTLKRPISKLCRLPYDREELPTIENNQPVKIPVPTKPPSRKRSHLHINPTNIPVRPSIEELKRTCLPAKQPKRVTTTAVTSLLLLNLILPVFSNTILPSTAHRGKISTEPLINIQQFEHNPGIYFEELGNMHLVNKEWNTIIYYNLSTYHQQLNGFHQCMERLEKLCDKMVTYNFFCRAILTEMSHKVQEMNHNNLILQSRNGNHRHMRRLRRAPFEIIGTIQSSLFGVLDQTYADYIENEINKVKDNENYLLNLAKNQTSIMEVTANVLKKTTEQIQQQFEVFNEHVTANLETLRQGIESNKGSQTFTAMVTYLNLITSTYERSQKELIDLLVDAHNGKISPFLLTPMQLREEIKFIREHITTSLIIPGEGSSEDLLNLYKLITVKSRITNENIIFKVTIPLPTASLYQVFRVYPVPTNHKSEFMYIEPSSDYLATTLHRDFLYPLTASEIKECIKTEDLGLLCKQHHPIYSTQSSMNQCEMRLLNHKKIEPNTCKIKKTTPSQYWIQLEHPNHWIYVTDDETTINIVCGKDVAIRTLNGSGLIKLNDDCTIKHKSMSISAQSSITIYKKSSFLPPTNLSSILPDLETSHQSIQPAPLSHLDTQDISKLTITKEFTTSLDKHHIHHYVSTYVIIILVIAALSWMIYQRLQPRRRIKINQETFKVQPVTPQPAKRQPKSPVAE